MDKGNSELSPLSLYYLLRLLNQSSGDVAKKKPGLQSRHDQTVLI